MLFKDKSDGQIEWNTKTGEVRLKKKAQEVINQKQHEIDNIVDYYREYKPKLSIKRLDAYKSFCIAIAFSTITIYKDVSRFLRHNNITDMSIAKYDSYILKKINWFSETYNTNFKKSGSKILEGITVKDILGAYSTLARQMIKDFFKTAYQTHLQLNERRQENVKKMNEQTDNPAERLNLLYSLMLNQMNEALDNDEENLYNLILEINNVLIGLWHDILIEYIDEEVKSDRL